MMKLSHVVGKHSEIITFHFLIMNYNSSEKEYETLSSKDRLGSLLEA